MPRVVQITVPSPDSQRLVDGIRQIDGVVGVRLQRQVSVQPPGDVIGVDITDAALPELMRILDHAGVGKGSGTSIQSSKPGSLISSSHTTQISSDPSEESWEEMEMAIARESNMTPNGLLVMFCAGVLAAFGISSGSLHVVVGAMLIAPGFEPITRVSLGLVNGSPTGWKRGVRHTILAYASLIVAAALGALILRAMGRPILSGGSGYERAGTLVAYWTTLTGPSLAITIAAALGGSLLIAAGRAILTGGVMVALALIPSAAIAGMAIISADWRTAAGAGMRWGVDVICVVALGLALFAWKRLRLHRRRTMM